MAYVPGLDHDLFLSYAHEDVTWVSALQEELTDRLLHRLGYTCDVWQDENKLRTGQNWTAELDKAIRASAAFISVLSRNYQRSTWCQRELDAFLDQAKKQGELEAAGYGRLLKVIKVPWYNNAHEGFYSQYQHVSFFDRDSKTGQEREFKRTSESFRNAVDKLGFHIEKLFDAMLRGREKVFVARAATDASEEREAIIREIRAAGYALSPPPEGALPRGLDRKTLRQFMNETRVTVHLLSATFEGDIREQIELAIEAEKKVVFCLTRGHESATGEQRKLIDEIRENKWKLPKEKRELLENRSLMALRRDLIALVAPQRPTVLAGQDESIRVYLLCDPSTEDADFVGKVQEAIREKERFEVHIPQPATNAFSPATEHERLLRECNGLLLYYEKAPPKWYSRNVVDLLTAENREARRELKSKAMLVGGAPITFPGMTVIQRSDPFNVTQLEPFLSPLRAVSSWLGGAHAG